MNKKDGFLEELLGRRPLDIAPILNKSMVKKQRCKKEALGLYVQGFFA
ncbi:hypothetical protein [Muricauda sp. NFXS6]